MYLTPGVRAHNLSASSFVSTPALQPMMRHCLKLRTVQECIAAVRASSLLSAFQFLPMPALLLYAHPQPAHAELPVPTTRTRMAAIISRLCIFAPTASAAPRHGRIKNDHRKTQNGPGLRNGRQDHTPKALAGTGHSKGRALKRK